MSEENMSLKEDILYMEKIKTVPFYGTNRKGTKE